MKKPQKSKYNQWFVACNDKTDKWIALDANDGEFTCSNHPIIKQGFTIYGCVGFKDPTDAINYVKEIAQDNVIYVAKRGGK